MEYWETHIYIKNDVHKQSARSIIWSGKRKKLELIKRVKLTQEFEE